MLDLSSFAGFYLFLDTKKNRLVFEVDGSSSFKDDLIVSLKDLFPVLLNKHIQYPQRVYRKYKNLLSPVFTEKGFYFDLYLIPCGLLGIEFIKSHIYYSNSSENNYDSVIQCYHGELVVIIQKHQLNADYIGSVFTKVDDIKIVDCKPGDTLFIPSGYFYTFINKGTEPVVFSRFSRTGSDPIDYSLLRKERGMAYFVISKNAKVEKVSNPKYRLAEGVRDIFVSRQDLIKSQEFKNLYLPLNFDSKSFIEQIDSIVEFL
ncbi:hypothetical protein D6810_03165 [Candidatus Dojkabacteria bacterium]|uniref:glucose-6-phosphate isomerase n=1 Tax=Candidatus Dojkabacteria bacterium TaxID=2099670 RepID=A0A3M0Z3M5_9BACT|nr:MAG: hypothetical protein D6810_03165 [Candidatus Dojkabacteria bacterium]